MITPTLCLLVLGQKAKLFSPVGTWNSRSVLVEAKTSEAMRDLLRSDVAEQNRVPSTLSIRKDGTYSLPREEGLWKLDGRKLWLTPTKQGKMRVNAQRYLLAVTADGRLVHDVNKLVRVIYTRAKPSRG